MQTELDRLRALNDTLTAENRRLTANNKVLITGLSAVVASTQTYSGATAPGICVGVFQTACQALSAVGCRVSTGPPAL